MECIPTRRLKKLRSAPPRHCHCLPRPPRSCMEHRGAKHYGARYLLYVRPLRTPRPHIGYVPTYRHKNYGAHHRNSVIGHHLWRKWAIHLYEEITFHISEFVCEPQGLFRDEISGNYYQPLVKRLAKLLRFGERMVNGWWIFLSRVLYSIIQYKFKK